MSFSINPTTYQVGVPTTMTVNDSNINLATFNLTGITWTYQDVAYTWTHGTWTPTPGSTSQATVSVTATGPTGMNNVGQSESGSLTIAGLEGTAQTYLNFQASEAD